MYIVVIKNPIIGTNGHQASYAKRVGSIIFGYNSTSIASSIVPIETNAILG